ncbi:MAG: phosphate butyryltransferase [Nitrospirae bacterium]|nr:phosphate butyryltransferase [Nitrospirota bacterium]
MNTNRVTDFPGLMLRVAEVNRCAPPPRVAVCAAGDDNSLIAMEQARAAGLAEPVLVGEAAVIRDMLAGLGINPDTHEIHDVSGQDDQASACVELVRAGGADIIMKGMIPTSTFLHPIFRKDTGLAAGGFISHVGVLEVPGFDRLIIQTDGGINIAPDFEMKKGIIMNAVFVARLLGVERPRVALLSASEKVHPRIQSTVDARDLVLWARDNVPDADVEGPMALDLAISPEAVASKGMAGIVAGHADILVASNIEMGNVIYKALRYFAHAEGAGIVVGATAPIILTSRSDPPRERLNSLALAVLYRSRIGDAPRRLAKKA